jgi:anti-anti-sigma factor
MHIERKDSNGETIFVIMEELVSQNINALTDELNRFVKTDNRDAVIDLSYVRKIDSISIAALIRIKNQLAEAGRSLHLTNPNESVFRVLELAGLEKFLLE